MLNESETERNHRVKRLKKIRKLREFFAEFIGMTEDQITKYINNPKNPAVSRKYAQLFLQCGEMSDVYRLAEETEGKIKEKIEVQSSQKVDLSMFGESNDDDNEENIENDNK